MADEEGLPALVGDDGSAAGLPVLVAPGDRLVLGQEGDAGTLAAAAAVALCLFAGIFAALVCLLRRAAALTRAADTNGRACDAAPPPENLVLVYTSKSNLLGSHEHRLDQLCLEDVEEEVDLGRII